MKKRRRLLDSEVERTIYGIACNTYEAIQKAVGSEIRFNFSRVLINAEASTDLATYLAVKREMEK